MHLLVVMEIAADHLAQDADQLRLVARGQGVPQAMVHRREIHLRHSALDQVAHGAPALELRAARRASARAPVVLRRR